MLTGIINLDICSALTNDDREFKFEVEVFGIFWEFDLLLMCPDTRRISLVIDGTAIPLIWNGAIELRKNIEKVILKGHKVTQ